VKHAVPKASEIQ